MVNQNIKDHNERLELYKQGFSDSEIGKRLHYERSSIGSWRRKNGLPLNRAPESEVVEILRNKPELTIKEICKMTNRSISYVYNLSKKYGLMTNGQKVRYETNKRKEERKSECKAV